MKSLASCIRGFLKILTNWGRLNAEKLRRPIVLEASAMTFVIVATISVYLYGVIYILPYVFSERSETLQWIAFLAATWCIFGILANLFFIKYRNPSIQYKFLSQPVIAPPPLTTLQHSDSLNQSPQAYEDHAIRERKEAEQIKYLGQQFMVAPLGSDTAWHICASCEVYVPPRSWHCNTCNTCILRRDHHCVFAMACIGEDNHIHFLGFLTYLAIGATYSTIVGMMYTFYKFDIPPLLYVVKSFFSWYIIFFDFSIMNLLASISFLGGTVSWAILVYYILLATKNQTSADKSRGIRRSVSGSSLYSYANLKEFLGPHPVLRMLWPLSPVVKSEDGVTNPLLNNRFTTKTV